MFSCKQGQTSGSNITKKIFWWNYFCNNYKDYHWGQNHYIPFVCLGELFSVVIAGNFTAYNFRGTISCNVMIGAVLPWQERIFRLQLQFFSPCYVRINYCNATPFLYRISSFQNIICNNFVPNGTGHAHAKLHQKSHTKKPYLGVCVWLRH